MHRGFTFLEVHSNKQQLIVMVFLLVLNRSVVTVYSVLREHIVDVYFSRLQCIWKLTDELPNNILAYKTELY